MSENPFQTMFEVASVGIAQADPRSGRWVCVNRKMCEITGYTVEEMLALRIPEITHPEDRERDWEAFQRVVRGDAPNYHLEKRYVRKDGTVVWVNVNMTVIRDAAGQPARTIATIEDISGRKAHESEILRLSRLYLAMSEMNQFITRAQTEDELLAGVCRILVQRGDLKMAWIGCPDPETSRVIPVAQYGDTGGYLDQVQIYTDSSRPEGRGPTGTAVREDRVMVCMDFARAIETEPFRSAGAMQGFGSSACFPIHEEGKVRGGLTVYASGVGFFRDKEIMLLAEAATNIGYALTHLKQEKAIRQNEKRNRALLMTTMDGFMLVDMEGRLLEVNESYCRMSGYDARELLDMRISDLEAAESESATAAHIQVVMERGEDRFESRHRRKDGSVFDVEVSVQSLPLEGGRFVAFLHDITERKRSEKKLRESEERFRLIAETITEVFWIADVQINTMLYVSPGYEKVWGRRVESLYENPKSFIEAIHEEDRERVVAALKLHQEGGLYSQEYRILQPGGEIRWVSDRGFPIRDETGKVARYIGIAQDITERKRVEEKRRESETRYHTVFEHSPIPIWEEDFSELKAHLEYLRAGGIDNWRAYFTTHPEQVALCAARIKVVSVNQTSVNFFGAKNKEEIPANLSFYFTEESLRVVKEELIALAEGKTLFESEIPIRFPNGAHKTLFLSLSVVPGHEQTLARVLVSFTDVTERIQMETYAEMTREVLKILNEPAGIRDSIARVLETLKTRTGFDAVGIRMQEGDDFPYYSQQGFSRDFLLTENTLLERTPDGGVCRDKDGNINLECTCGLVVSGKTVPSHPFFTKGGSFWTNDSSPLLQFPPDEDPRRHPRNRCIHHGFASLALVPIRNEERIVGLIQFNDRRKGCFSIALVELLEGIASHIGTALMRKRMEERLRMSEAKSRAIIDASPVPMAMNNEELQITFLNPAFVQTFGYTQDDIPTLAQWWSKAYPDPEYRQWVTNTWQANLEKAKQTGAPITPMEVTVRCKDGTNKVVLATAALFSVLIEGNHLVVLYDITERKNAEEEKIRLEGMLQQAQKMESVGRLAGGVAHDFNNMLGVILGHAEMALRKVDPSQPLHASLQEIQNAGQHSADLTRQLLAFARQQTIEPKELNLNETIAGMLKMLQRLMGENIQLGWLPGADLWPVKMDPSQLDQILANLCINGRDAISDIGKITIETENATLDEHYCAVHAGFVPGEYARITISDNGHGMDKKTLEHIFEPFFTTKGVGKGTGLGLATVYGAVRQNNGFINVYSEMGKGTTFTIHLPRLAKTTERDTRTNVAAEIKGGAETILLVEDEPAILQMTTQMLEMQGYTVLPAGTPDEAIRMAANNSAGIHLLMTDVVMPEMSGRDLAAKLHALHPHLKCLFTSGYTADVISRHGVLDKGIHFIQKPFSMQNLDAKVREALGEGNGGIKF